MLTDGVSNILSVAAGLLDDMLTVNGIRCMAYTMVSTIATTITPRFVIVP